MLRLRTRGINAAGWLTILALIAMTSIIGCGGNKEAPTAPAAAGDEEAQIDAALTSAGAAAPGAAQQPAATGGRRGGGRAGRAGAGDTGGRAPAAAAQQPAATPSAPSEGAEAAADFVISEVDAAQKIQNFANLYGPITRVQERNWDDRVIEWVVFTPPNATWVTPAHRGRRAKLPLSMIMDADAPEALEGYFQIYPTGSSAGQTVSSQTITASAGAQIAAAGATQTTATETTGAKATQTQAPKPAESQATAAPAQAPPAGASGTGRGGRRGGGRGGRAQ